MEPVILPERRFVCDECGFDARAMSDQDLVAALASYAKRYRMPLTRFLPKEGDGAAVVRARPAADVWSALEYACHQRDVFAFYRERIERVLAADEPPRLDAVGFGTLEVEQTYNEREPAAVADAIAEEAGRLAALLADLDEDGWRRVGLASDGSGAERSVRVLAERATHEGHHHLLDIGRSLRAARSG
jgi:hypothetical protein